MSCLIQIGKLHLSCSSEVAQRSLAPAHTAVPAKKSAPQGQEGSEGSSRQKPLKGDAGSRAMGMLHTACVTNAIK